MDELLAAILELILEFLLEAAFEFAAEFLSVAVLRGIAAVFETSEFKNPVLASAGYLFLGGLAGALSLALVPHPIVHRSRVPGLSVIVSPFLVGLAMSWVGSAMRRKNKEALQIESFGYGFAFAFGMALVRFLFVS